MTLLKHGNSKDNCSGDVTYKQPISKQISYRPYKRIAYFIGYFYKEDFLDWLLDLGDLFDFKRLHVEEYVEVKEENIEISEEFHEGLIIEEYPKIKINEDPSIHKDLEVKMVETIKEEIIEEVVNDLDEIKLDHCNVQASIILVGDTETKFIDFIGVEI